jgi:hypothetical protein
MCYDLMFVLCLSVYVRASPEKVVEPVSWLSSAGVCAFNLVRGVKADCGRNYTRADTYYVLWRPRVRYWNFNLLCSVFVVLFVLENADVDISLVGWGAYSHDSIGKFELDQRVRHSFFVYDNG